MDVIPEEILLAAAHCAMLDQVAPEQTMAVIFRALDHEIMGPSGTTFNPARTAGIGEAIYAAMYAYPFELKSDSTSPNGWRWIAQLPEHGFSPPFQALFVSAMLLVDVLRERRSRDACV